MNYLTRLKCLISKCLSNYASFHSTGFTEDQFITKDNHKVESESTTACARKENSSKENSTTNTA